jgi:hypothetical protein
LQAVLASGSISGESAYYAAQIFHDAGESQAAAGILQKTLAQASRFPARDRAEALLRQLSDKKPAPPDTAAKQP